MSDYKPPLDRPALLKLRGLVKQVHAAPKSGIPIAEAVSIQSGLPEGIALTVDFEASRDLGHEMIVVRVAEAAQPQPDPVLACLSQRELEIAAMIARGCSNKTIASELFISLATVKAHVHHIFTKTGLPNRTAVATAYHGAVR
jgi:DNA-binding NarL/FixJ family response regulator